MRHFLATLMTLGIVAMAPAAAAGEPPAATDTANADDSTPTDRDEAAPETPSRSFDERPVVGDIAICPVRLTTFTVEPGTVTSRYRGRHYAFCCMACKAPFEASPEQYVPARKGPRPDAVPSWVRTLRDFAF